MKTYINSIIDPDKYDVIFDKTEKMWRQSEHDNTKNFSFEFPINCEYTYPTDVLA